MTLCEGALRCPFAFFVFRGRWFWAGVRGGWFWCAVAQWLVHGASCRVRWRGGRCVARRAGGALLPRRSLCSRSPGAGATRPYPRTPTRGKLSLQAFARCARVLVVLAHGATRPCALARGAMCCTARWWRAPAAPLALLAVPGGRGCAPLSPDPYPRQAELAGFCALSRACCASRRCFLCWRMVLPVCLCWRMQRPAVCAFAPRWRGEVLTVSAISSSVGLCFPSCLISSMMLSVSCAV